MNGIDPGASPDLWSQSDLDGASDRIAPTAPIICISIAFLSVFEYKRGMSALDRYLDDQLSRGRAYFTREEVRVSLRLTPAAFLAAPCRLARKQPLASPRPGIYPILLPDGESVVKGKIVYLWGPRHIKKKKQY